MNYRLLSVTLFRERLKADSELHEDIDVDVESQELEIDETSPTSSENFPVIQENKVRKNVIELSQVIKKKKKMPDLMPIRPNVVVKSNEHTKPQIHNLVIDKVGTDPRGKADPF